MGGTTTPLVSREQQHRWLDLAHGKLRPGTHRLQRPPRPEESDAGHGFERKLVVDEHSDVLTFPVLQAMELGGRQTAHKCSRSAVEHTEPQPLRP